MKYELRVKNLTKHFGGIKALQGVNLSFAGGKIYAVIGPNGSGKTTFVDILTGFKEIDKGQVIINNRIKVEKINPENIFYYGITRTFQQSRLVNQLSVLDNILIILTEKKAWRSLFKRWTQKHVAEAEDILKMVGLYDSRNKNAEDLSYGQRKLLEVGRALATKANIFFFDEPFAGMFQKRVEEIEQILLNLKEENKIVILIEHDMDIIKKIVDYCYVLDNGKLLAKGIPDEVLQKKEVVEAYLGK